MRNNLTPDKPFSLREEMKRRKLAEFDRDLEERKQARVRGTAPLPSKAATTTSTVRPIASADRLRPGQAATTSTIRPIAPLPESRRTTTHAVAPGAVPITRMSAQNLNSVEIIMLIGIGIGVLLVLILVGLLILR